MKGGTYTVRTSTLLVTQSKLLPGASLWCTRANASCTSATVILIVGYLTRTLLHTPCTSAARVSTCFARVGGHSIQTLAGYDIYTVFTSRLALSYTHIVQGLKKGVSIFVHAVSRRYLYGKNEEVSKSETAARLLPLTRRQERGEGEVISLQARQTLSRTVEVVHVQRVHLPSLDLVRYVHSLRLESSVRYSVGMTR